MRRFFSIVMIIAILVSICCGGYLFWSHANIEKIVDRAEAIAGNESYCIQTADGADYKEARTLSDLSGLNMQANGPPYWNHHAILVLGTRLMHWSFRKQDFMPGAINEPAIYCTSRPHFAKKLSADTPITPASLTVHVAGMDFSVPMAFRARIYGGSVVSGYGPGMTFYAKSPSFSPVSGNYSNRKKLVESDMNNVVDVNFKTMEHLQLWPKVNDQLHIVENAESIFNLKKKLIWDVDLERNKKTRQPYAQYFREENGHLITLISCSENVDTWCLHTFEQDGWTYSFRHSLADIQHWKSMQQSLVTLTKSFLVKKNVSPVPKYPPILFFLA